MENPARILIIRFSSIGDIVLTTPLVRCLKKQMEMGVEIHFLTKKKYATLLTANPYITKIHTIEKSVQEVLPELEKCGFDYVVDLHKNIRSYIVKKRLKVLSFSFRKVNFAKWMLVKFGKRRNSIPHVVERYLETVFIFGVKDDEKPPDYFIPPNEGLNKKEIPDVMNQKFVVWCIGGMHQGKRMSKEKVAAIISMCKHPVVIIGGVEDEMEGDFIAEHCGSRVFNAAGKFSLHQSADCISRAEVVVTGDTGMMHIASAFSKKIISVWGCTTPELGMSAWRPHPSNIIIEPKHLTKRPCSKLGDRCKYGDEQRCIGQNSNDEILQAIETLWVQQTAP
ncbi:MAG: glycosyltransferase family 9 protein [Flavobacteriales bacterium]|nr:glycosyltransferase family 9 protein [Flavobacteriales bacterium]